MVACFLNVHDAWHALGLPNASCLAYTVYLYSAVKSIYLPGMHSCSTTVVQPAHDRTVSCDFLCHANATLNDELCMH